MGALNCCQSAHCVQIVVVDEQKTPCSRLARQSASKRCSYVIDVDVSSSPRMKRSVSLHSCDELDKEGSYRVSTHCSEECSLPKDPFPSPTPLPLPPTKANCGFAAYITGHDPRVPIQTEDCHSQGWSQLRLSDYLCSCEQCPLAQSIAEQFRIGPNDDKSLGYTIEPAIAAQRLALYRLLRACATYDETRPLDRTVFFYGYKLLFEQHMNENDAFRLMIANLYHSTANGPCADRLSLPKDRMRQSELACAS